MWLFTTRSLLVHLPSGMLEGGTGQLSLRNWRDSTALKHAIIEGGAGTFLPARDGSLWIGGLGGLEHFNDANLVHLLPDATPGRWEHCFEPDGSQWIIDGQRRLSLRKPDGTTQRRAIGAEALYCSSSGNLLRTVAGPSTLNEKRIALLPGLPALKAYNNDYTFTGATRTTEGSIVAAATGEAIGRSLWRYNSGRWSQLLRLRPGSEITALYANAETGVYLGFRDGSIAVLKPGAAGAQLIGSDATDAVSGFAQSREGLLAYGKSGIALLRRGLFVTIAFLEPRSAQMVTGLCQSVDGDVWLNGAKGVVQIKFGELEAVLRNPLHKVISNYISEGEYTDPAATGSFSQSVQSVAKDRVWFATLSGIESLVPSKVKPSEPPPLVIESVLADGTPLPQNRRLQPGVNTLSIRYIGVDFLDPSDLSYSYKLSGYDGEWQDVGARTEAVYTHLRAGRYTFIVKARNAFGVSTPPLVLEPFVIQPHFYERRWFLVAPSFLAIALMWLAVQLRLRFAAAGIRRSADERADERINIARDLHDTLLQGVQGLLLTFHAAIEGVPAYHESRPALEHALSSAESLIIEGRDRVKGLRGTHVSGDELGQVLQAVAQDLGCTKHFELKVSPSPLENILRADVAAEIFLVGREALLNAVRHAPATHIIIRLQYDPTAFILECEDDGVGFDTSVSNSRVLPRWGIPGMHERIEALHGSVRIQSVPGEGTLVRITLKAKFAYA